MLGAYQSCTSNLSGYALSLFQQVLISAGQLVQGVERTPAFSYLHVRTMQFTYRHVHAEGSESQVSLSWVLDLPPVKSLNQPFLQLHLSTLQSNTFFSPTVSLTRQGKG